ncbi:PTS lactose/cellobiose transporter subunit IIA [Tetragenococcus halophilus]|uniref:PTS lactose/cellobiose transporter subunit IIA n=1 Tax=Tetragenococcus halophilus TaxID=51669 RepID=UPI00209A7A46|nr:PTS lactose/cellobiose transporter subunit IIA [Tetragenococcus halophilus]MCO8289102.1 PTS lactose/cellobiose transporter subunit IIA [Tetragenococcus halophilus]
MNKQEVSMIGFEIVAYAGEARSQLLDALNEAKNGEFEQAEMLIEKASKTLSEAHQSQTQMLSKEANGEEVDLGFIMVHGQDHLMTALLLKDLVKHIIELYKKGGAKVE